MATRMQTQSKIRDPWQALQRRKKGGNKIAKVLAAPFKAFGRLFGHNGDRKIERMTEKDAEKFASVGVSRVDDARTVDAKKLVSTTAKEHLAAGREYLLSGRINEAVTELSTAASLDPKLTEAHNLLGVAYDQKGLAERAKESYERAIKVQPEESRNPEQLGVFALSKW
jgi:Flp pilus assembly protein TadD